MIEEMGIGDIPYWRLMFDPLFFKTGLSFDRLRSFLEMAEAGGIAAAAPGDAVRQSQISRQIRELEAFFGTELTRRSGKSLVLTESGRRLAGLVRLQLQGLEDFRREAASEPKSFVIGAGASILEWLVTPRLPAMATTLGDAQLKTESYRSEALVAAVREGRIDLAVVRRDAILDASRKNCETLMKLSLHLCVPRKLLPRQTGAEDLHDHRIWNQLPFAAGRDGGKLDAAIREAMQRAGIDFRPRFECGSMLQVRQLLAQGDCAAILTNLALHGLDERMFLISEFAPLADHGRTLVLHWNPRQMERRGVDAKTLRQVAAGLR